jgi:hypothetical protein
MSYTTIAQSVMMEYTISAIDAIMLAKDASTGSASGGLHGHVTNAIDLKVGILLATNNLIFSPGIDIEYH